MEFGFDVHNHATHHYLRSSSLDMTRNYSETMVVSPISHHHHHPHHLPHWNQSLRSELPSGSSMASEPKKRDFHFQVIEVNQGPKWFFFPNQQAPEEEEKVESKSDDTSPNYQKENNQHHFASSTPIKRGSLIRRKEQFQQMHNVAHVDSGLTRATSTNCGRNEPSSEPTTRRLNCRPVIKVTQSPSIPIKTNSVELSCSSSVPSSTFKILSVAKKNWESDDEENIECSCRKLSLSLDDDCDLPRETHCAGYLSSSSSSGCSTGPSTISSTSYSTN